MKLNNTIIIAMLICAGGFVRIALADPPEDVMKIVRDVDIKWKHKLGGDFQTAVLAGDPSKPEPYVVRVKFAPGTISPPHFHPEMRYIVVLKGTYWVGAGPRRDRDAMTPVSTGSLVVHHPNKIHYDGAKDEEVLLQIVGVGPSETNLVDESGQPKK